ncbi:hypothetical protein ACN20G_15725 [Streptomyces sp. BI20]|uniref:hypothetical protein n=1 Tax=Streptomyces sp. BI20 TaxID=3403460 RepID=UPI003C772059
MHRRTALSVSAVLLAAAPLLTACSGQARPGTAALVGGERITTSALQARVDDVRGEQRRADPSGQLVAGSGRLEGVQLGRMIQVRIVDRLAKDAGVSASTKEVEDARRAATAETGSPGRLIQGMLQLKVPVAPDGIDEYFRYQILLGKLTQKYGEAGLTERAQALAEKLDITVNPRYGEWKPQEIGIRYGETPWISQRSVPQDQQPPRA